MISEFSESKKISIVGNSAAGKSTISMKLGNHLGLQVLTVDKIFWLPEWQLRDKHSFTKRHNEWLSLNSWIIDGVGYWENMMDRISQSDLVIFLDVPASVCRERAELRIREEQELSNPYISAGCIYGNVKAQQMAAIDGFHSELRPKLIAALSKLDKKNVIIVTSPEELGI